MCTSLCVSMCVSVCVHTHVCGREGEAEEEKKQLRREYKEFVDKEANLGDVRHGMISGKRKGEKENQETAINK